MAKLSQRQRRAGAAIHRTVAEILRREGSRFSLRLTISEVRPSPDLRHARIFLQGLTGEEMEEAMRELQGARRKFQKIIGTQLQLRFTPVLSFHPDASLEKAAALEKIFQSEKVAADLAPKLRDAEAPDEKG